MKKIELIKQKIRQLIAEDKTAQAIKLGGTLSAYVSEADLPIRTYMTLFSNRYKRAGKRADE
jgi:hypothetical protein